MVVQTIEQTTTKIDPVHIQLLVFTILAGASWPAGRIIAQNVDPITASYYRYLIALPLFSILLWKQPSSRISDVRVHIRIFLLSILNITLYNILFLEGIKRTTASEATLVFASTPTLTIILAHFMYSDERITKIRVTGIVSAFLGVFLIFLSHETSNESHLNGNSIILLSALVMALYTVLARPLFKSYNLIQLSSWMIFYGLFSLAIFVPFENPSHLNPTYFINLPSKVILSIAYLGVYIAYAIYAYNKGIQKIGSSKTSIYMNLIPVFGIISSIVLIGESFLLIYLISFMLIFLGIILVNRK